MTHMIDSLLVFHTVNLSMKAEKVLRAGGVPFKVLPLPKEIARGCSIAIGINGGDLAAAREALDQANTPLEAVYSRRGERWGAGRATEAARAATCRIYLDHHASTPRGCQGGHLFPFGRFRESFQRSFSGETSQRADGRIEKSRRAAPGRRQV